MHQDPLLHSLSESSFAQEWKAILQILLAPNNDIYSSAQIKRLAYVKKRLLLELLQDVCILLNGKPALEAFVNHLECNDKFPQLDSSDFLQKIGKILDNRIQTVKMMISTNGNSSFGLSDLILHHRKCIVQHATKIHLELASSTLNQCASILRRLSIIQQQIEQNFHSAHMISTYKNKSLEHLNYLKLLLQSTANKTKQLKERLQGQLFSRENLETLAEVKRQLIGTVEAKKAQREASKRQLQNFIALGPSFAKVAAEIAEKRQRIQQLRREICVLSKERLI
jgi:hypothetical protein